MAEPNSEKTRRCYICGKTKPLSSFSKNSRDTSGHRYECKACQAFQAVEWYSKNREVDLARNKKWKEENKQRVKEYNRKRRIESHPEILLKIWSEEEKKTLIDNYQIKLKDELIQLLPKKTWGSIQRMMDELGLQRHPHGDRKIKYDRENKRGVRVCNICGKEKPLTDFYHGSKRCRPCLRELSQTPEGKEKQRLSSAKASSFRTAFQGIKERGNWRRKPVDPNLSWEDVKTIIEKQDYKCALIGLPLNRIKSRAWDPLTPSLDRIDNSKGYELGNIRWVCLWANIARHNWTDQEFYELCKKTTEYHDNLLGHNA